MVMYMGRKRSPVHIKYRQEVRHDIISLEGILGRFCIEESPVFEQEVLYLLAVIVDEIAKAYMQRGVVQVLYFDGLEIPYPCRCVKDYIELVVNKDVEVSYHIVYKCFAV